MFSRLHYGEYALGVNEAAEFRRLLERVPNRIVLRMEEQPRIHPDNHILVWRPITPQATQHGKANPGIVLSQQQEKTTTVHINEKASVTDLLTTHGGPVSTRCLLLLLRQYNPKRNCDLLRRLMGHAPGPVGPRIHRKRSHG